MRKKINVFYEFVHFLQLLPLFTQIASKFYTNDKIVEALCDCTKRCIVTLLEQTRPFLERILVLFNHLYTASQSIYVLKSSRQIFILFVKSPDLVQLLCEYYHSLAQVTLAEFGRDYQQNDPDLVATFYEESTQIVKKCTEIFSFAQLNVRSIWAFAIQGILLSEKGSIHQCSAFLCESINKGRKIEQLNSVIQEQFDALVMQIFTVIGDVHHTSVFAMDSMTNIVIALNQKYFDTFSRTLNSMVEVEGFPTKHVQREHRAALVKAVVGNKNSKRKMKDTLNEFSQRCRGVYESDTRVH